MIPVKPQPEPDDFDRLVRIPGKNFLKGLFGAKPTDKQWRENDDWKEVRSELIESYHRICAYYAHWIPSASCIANIDHFIPKSVEPKLAYEWSNFRLACPLANTRKKNYQDVLDPFTIGEDWFVLEFPSLYLKPNPQLPTNIQQQICATIKRLKLNDYPTLVDERTRWLKMYCEGASFDFLKINAPFIAHELKRQNLVEEIKNMMDFEQDIED